LSKLAVNSVFFVQEVIAKSRIIIKFTKYFIVILIS
jgi:hypothetical protein